MRRLYTDRIQFARILYSMKYTTSFQTRLYNCGNKIYLVAILHLEDLYVSLPSAKRLLRSLFLAVVYIYNEFIKKKESDNKKLAKSKHAHAHTRIIQIQIILFLSNVKRHPIHLYIGERNHFSSLNYHRISLFFFFYQIFVTYQLGNNSVTEIHFNNA